MKKFFLSLAVFVMAICVNAQTNQYFWYHGNLMMGNPIAQIDSITFGENEPTDTLHILLPRTIIKTIEVHDTTIVAIHDTTIIHDTVFLNCPIEGTLIGEFSISPTNKIYFSKGNLQYQASTDLWRFAENQYDIIGDDNQNISSTNNGWIDLFGWGTGNNPTNSSYSYFDYSNFVEWGTNAIINGSNIANQWRTLTKDEWVYLFYGRMNATTLFGMGSVNGINGIILLPNNWVTPTGLSFTASTTLGLTDRGSDYFDGNNSHFTDNTYTVEQWSVMENAGAVFLPAAGERWGKNVGISINSYGYYWSDTPYSSQDAYYMRFDLLSLYPQSKYARENGRGYGQSVRLVRDVE